MITADDNFTTIVVAVKEGIMVHVNYRNNVLVKLS